MESPSSAPPLSSSEEDKKSSQPPQRSFVNKFATIGGDLRRDLLLSNFDRNLTVEETHFDGQDINSSLSNGSLASSQANNAAAPPQPPMITVHQPGDTSPTLLPLDNHHPAARPAGHHLNSSNTPGGGANGSSNSNSNHPSHHAAGSSAAPKRKTKRTTPMHSTATPSEYFHRNLVDAVSNVEDSDENEYYVYPYSGGEWNGNTSDHGYFPKKPRSVRSKKSINDFHHPPRRHDGQGSNGGNTPTGTTFATPQPSPSPSPSPYRPKLRSYVMDPHASKKEYRSSSSSNARRYARYPLDGYASDDDEGMPLVRKERRKRNRQSCPSICMTAAACLLFLLLAAMVMWIIGSAKPLRDVTTRMDHVLASDKELILDFQVVAYNPNGWSVRIASTDISIFAFRLNQTTLNAHQRPPAGVEPAEFVGSFDHFDEPLVLSSSLLSGLVSSATSQIRIKSPGDDQGGNQRWSSIIRHSYGLLARGVVSYNPVPGLPSSQTVAICNAVTVDPVTSIITTQPDQDYCSKSDGTIV
ncbi:hypothetical protein BC940DRAFT_290816 [Gongronella butleri]|nr:hypothetical protein BC940DRAFT_290816 [Gongronella butleri]